ncbi:Translocator protein [Eumeta japonica]|uniref:Translocator protein n=1 Tax=Eumeta variegata TaxID=151549 RepID=A0A4C1YII8_EUMVA|nr:Translocator protein [Eumeta japonica]
MSLSTHLPVLGSIILPNIGGIANGYYFMGEIRQKGNESWYDKLKKPTWTPPKRAFGPVWTALYSGMGFASYLVYRECGGFTLLPLSLYGGQLALNWAWTPIFFGMKDFKLAFIEISVLSGAVIATTIAFFNVDQTAGLLMVPYVAWMGLATALTHYIWKNNPNPNSNPEKDGKEK